MCKAKKFQLLTGDVFARNDEENVSRLPAAAICEDVFPHDAHGGKEEVLDSWVYKLSSFTVKPRGWNGLSRM